MTGKATQTRVIKVVMDNKASAETKKISRDVAQLNKNVKKTSKSMSSMNGILGQARTAFAGLAAAMGVREIIRSADAFQLVKDRIRALWGEGVDAEETLTKIHKVAKDTNAPLETLADGFARISLSAKGMGLSVDDTARGVKSLQQTLRLSGASVAEVNSVYLQFSQAMGLSRLQGQELRAVMLGNAKLAGLLAEEFNTTRGALRDLGEKGLLDTARIFQMLIDKGGELDEQASKLKVTFGQAMIKAFDAFRVQIDRLNVAIGGSQGFAKAVDVMTKNMDVMAGVISGIVAGGLFYKIAYGINAMTAAMVKASATAFFAFLVSPAGLIAAGAAIVGAIAALTTFANMQEKAATKSIDHLLKEERLTVRLDIATKNYQNRIAMLKKMNKRDTNYAGEANKLVMDRVLIKSLETKLKLQKGANAEARKGNKIKPQTSKALTDMQKLNATLDERNKITKSYLLLSMSMDLAEIDKKFKADKMSGLEYNNQLIKINEEYRKMLLEMEAIANKDNVFYGIKRGAEEYVKSVGAVAEETAKVTTQAFGHLEDNLMEFIKKGKFEFSKFAQAIMDDITRMVIRMSIIKPLAGAISGGISGSSGGNTGDPNGIYTQAKGGAWNNGKVIPFAGGGVVTSPTYFGMSGSKTGLMGEAGPEAILPLSRGPGGKLGVSGTGTVVNVINNSSAETETQETTKSDGTKQIDVYIVNKVGEAIGEGRFDKSFQQLYGMQRRGS